MKAPKNCPICGEKMYLANHIHQSWCNKGLVGDEEHMFWCILSGDNKHVMEIEVQYDMPDDTHIDFDWDIDEQYCYLNRYDDSEIKLPFFEPDFDNMPKLLEKLKTYTVFA